MVLEPFLFSLYFYKNKNNLSVAREFYTTQAMDTRGNPVRALFRADSWPLKISSRWAKLEDQQMGYKLVNSK